MATYTTTTTNEGQAFLEAAVAANRPVRFSEIRFSTMDYVGYEQTLTEATFEGIFETAPASAMSLSSTSVKVAAQLSNKDLSTDKTLYSFGVIGVSNNVEALIAVCTTSDPDTIPKPESGSYSYPFSIVVTVPNTGGQDIQGSDTPVICTDDVVNALTSTSIDKPLSAYQGKVLKDEIDNLDVSDLHNVDTTGVSDGDLFKYDGTEQKWVAGPSPSGSFEGLSDVQFTSLQNGDVPIYNSTANKWKNGSIDISSKVDKVTTATNGDIASFNSSGNIQDTGVAASSLVLKSQTSGLLKNDGTIDTNSYALSSSLGTAAAKNSTGAVTTGSSDLVESGAVKSAIDAAISSVYKPSGDKAVAELIASLLVASNSGNVYNITDSGTTTADFVGGAGRPINIGDNVAIVDTGTAQNPVYKFDLLSGMVDLSNYVQKSSTSGLLKNDGTVDTNTYLTSHQDISGKADKVVGATNGHLAGLDSNGNITDSGVVPSTLMAKASSPTAGHIATVDASGQVVDSGYVIGQIPVNPTSTAGLNIWIVTS